MIQTNSLFTYSLNAFMTEFMKIPKISFSMNIRVLFIIFCGLLTIQSWAQPTDLPSEEVDVEKKFNAILAQSEKYNTTPTLPPLDTMDVTTQTYSIPPKLLTLDYQPPVIRPLAMRRAPKLPVYRFYTKAGYGLPSMPYVDLRFNNGQSEQIDFNAQFFHHSANASQNVENQRFSDNKLALGATYFLEDGYAVNGHASYSLNGVHFYGYDSEADSSTVDRELVLQRFSTIQAGAKFFNNEETRGDLNYRASLDVYNLSDRYDATELGVKAKLGFDKWVDEHLFQATLTNQLVRFNDTLAQINNVLAFEPSFTLNTGIVSVKLGAYLGYDGQFVPRPDLEVAANLMDGKLVLFGGWNGSIQQNSFQTLTSTNPFLVSQLQLKNTRVQNRYAGVKGQFSQLGYEIRATQRPTQDLVLYLNDYAGDSTRFQVLYDTVNIINLHGTVSATPIKGLDLLFSADYLIFNPQSQEAAWHLPPLTVNISAAYDIVQKVELKGALYVASGAPYQDALGTKQTLNTLFDVNFGASYQVNENFSLFLDANNLLSSKYQRWHRYPNFGVNVLGGVIVRFQ